MTSLRFRIAAATLAGSALIGGAVIGTQPAIAQDGSTEDHSHRHPHSVQDRVERMQARIDQLLADGQITEERAEQMRTRLEDRSANAAEHAANAQARQAEREARMQELADLLQTTPDELRESRRAGESLADIAAANGVDVETVIDLLETHALARIDAAVESGRIDETEATEKRAEVRDRITARVNGEGSDQGSHLGRRRGRGHFHHRSSD